MKSYLLAALVAMPAFTLASYDAHANGCRGHGCGYSRNWTPDRHHPGGFINTVVTRDIFVSDRPAPGFGTNIQIRAGSTIDADCSIGYGWCRVRSPRFRNMFVPGYCLRVWETHYRPRETYRNRYYSEHNRRHREYGGGAYEERYEDERAYSYRPNGNGNGYYNRNGGGYYSNGGGQYNGNGGY
jgi:hypothetical protein